MRPNYFFTLDCFQQGRQYLEERGFAPVSVTTIRLSLGEQMGEVTAPAIVAVENGSDPNRLKMTYLIFGEQWAVDEDNFAEIVLLTIDEQKFDNDGNEILPILPHDEATFLKWN